MTARTGSLSTTIDVTNFAPSTRTRGGCVASTMDTTSFYPSSRCRNAAWSRSFNTGALPDLESPMSIIQVLQNTATTISIFMRDSSTGVGRTGISTSAFTINAKKSNVSSFSVITPTVTETGLGWYDLAILVGHVDTYGKMPLNIAAPNALTRSDVILDVIALNQFTDPVHAGLSALPNVAAGGLGGLPINAVRTATAQGAGTGSNQIQLDAGASATDGFYSRSMVSIISGTGAGQTRFIASYVGSTKTASLNKNWGTVPDNTSVYTITGASNSLLAEGLAQAGAANTITLRSNETAVNDTYKNTWIHITSGTGAGQIRLITGYVGSTKVATVDLNWVTNPDSTSVYQILTGADVSVSSTTQGSIGTTLLDTALSGHTTAGTVGAALSLVATPPSAATIRDAILDAARSGHVTLGTIGEGIAIATALLQGNFYMDETVNTNPNGQTSARIRCFLTGTAAAAATPGGSGQGEFATFVVTTTYSGINKITDHRVVQQ